MSVPKLPTVPPPVISGYEWSLKGTVVHIFDPNTGIAGSGGYRAARPSDFGAGGGSINVSLTGNSAISNTGFVTSGVRISATTLSGNSGAAGTLSPLLTSAENGAILVQQANLDKTQDTVRAFPLQGATIATGGRQGAQIGTTGALTVFSANPNRNLLFLQNLNTGILYVSLSGAASIVNYNMILKAGSTLDDANGGIWNTDTWLGSVSVSGLGNYRITAFEF
jgi:hypothetical protein